MTDKNSADMMSSMVPFPRLATLVLAVLAPAALVAAQEPSEWDVARANLVAQQPGPMAAEISRWQRLYNDTGVQLPFAAYAGFLLAMPGFPDEDTLRSRAEQRLRSEFVPTEEVLAFFDRHPPLGNHARAQYAIALGTRDAAAALRMAREAWRGGEMSSTAELALNAMHGAHFTQADHDARMDALLWQREREAAARQLERVSPGRRRVFAARLETLQGGDGATDDPAAAGDPGWLYNRSRALRQKGRSAEAVRLIIDAPALRDRPFSASLWVAEMLALARTASPHDSVRIAARLDEAFAPGEDISAGPFRLRDDYTSLMWLAGTNALWRLGDGAAAAPLFHRYGAAARTPQTRSKGFFWEGEAARRAGDTQAARAAFERAAAHPERFYGQMALARLGRPLPPFPPPPEIPISEDTRAAFMARPLTRAVSEVARDAPWAVGIRFYRAIADQASTLEEHLLVAELARQIGRRDLAVILAEAAGADGHSGFTRIGFPRLPPLAGTNWTMVHAITRQESQFAQNAISHAGARGLMQLMPGTAQEEAQRAGMRYLAASLIDDPQYNVRLGSNHIERLLARYNGSFPLAIAAYNAGPGNVNRWLRENGDPRTGAIDWLEWIERIGFNETRTYVHRVIENAVVYEALYPEDAGVLRPRGIEDFLR